MSLELTDAPICPRLAAGHFFNVASREDKNNKTLLLLYYSSSSGTQSAYSTSAIGHILHKGLIIIKSVSCKHVSWMILIVFR